MRSGWSLMGLISRGFGNRNLFAKRLHFEFVCQGKEFLSAKFAFNPFSHDMFVK